MLPAMEVPTCQTNCHLDTTWKKKQKIDLKRLLQENLKKKHFIAAKWKQLLIKRCFHWSIKIVMSRIKEEELRRQQEEQGPVAPHPLFIYTPKDSRLRFLAPKHTSRLLFLSEVPHSAKRLGDRAEVSCAK